MPSVTTGANAANRDLTYIGVSGDGDSLSIGMGQFAHVIRRNLNMCYIIENNGVYGLTKGQYSASADVGSVVKKAAPNKQMPIDPVSTAIGLGATYIARSFSGDKQQLVPLIKGGTGSQRLCIARHHQSVRDVQRPRRFDEELCIHAAVLSPCRSNFGARPHAVCYDRRECGKPGFDLHRRIG